MSGWTLAFQIINFLVLAGLLHRFLFKPIRAMVAKRQKELETGASEGERVRKEAEDLFARAKRELAEAAEARSRAAGESRTQIEEERSKGVVKAHAEAAVIVEAAHREVHAEREKAASSLADEAVELGTAVARRLLAEVATGDAAGPFFERLCAHLDAMPADKRRALRDELDGHELLVALTPLPSAEVAKRWTGTIADRLGQGIATRVVVDDSLVAGAELRFPHTTLSFSWRDGLKAAREELLHHDDRR